MDYKIKYISLSVLFTVCFGYAGIRVDTYSNPILRVLLEKVPLGKTAVFTSDRPLRIWGNPLDEYRTEKGEKFFNKNRITFTLYKKNRLSINRKHKTKNAAFIFSELPIRFGNRLYSGAIRLIPKGNRLYAVNFVRLEEYLEGIINAEINSSWHPEAVKSQAVVSRTFAMFRRLANRRKNWDITDTERDQVYKGIGIGDARGRRAISATMGQHIRKNNRVVESFFHSNSGGHTEVTENIWHRQVDFDKAIKTPYGKSDPGFYWTYKMTHKKFIGRLREKGVKINSLSTVRISERYASQRSKTIELQPVGADEPLVIDAKRLRRYLGHRNIKSLLFGIETDKKNVIFSGRGFGHGIGLCQWCAKDMAENGFNYTEIIAYFYDDVRIEQRH